MSTALRSVGFLDVLSSTPAESSRRAPCIHARLRRLATKPGEKCGLATVGPSGLWGGHANRNEAGNERRRRDSG